MTEQITDTDRLDFIQIHEAELKKNVEPGCDCSKHWGWYIEIGEELYFGYNGLRNAIDEAIKACKCKNCVEKRKVK